jgi:hypothetical protein
LGTKLVQKEAVSAARKESDQRLHLPQIPNTKSVGSTIIFLQAVQLPFLLLESKSNFTPAQIPTYPLSQSSSLICPVSVRQTHGLFILQPGNHLDAIIQKQLFKARDARLAGFRVFRARLDGRRMVVNGLGGKHIVTGWAMLVVAAYWAEDFGLVLAKPSSATVFHLLAQLAKAKAADAVVADHHDHGLWETFLCDGLTIACHADWALGFKALCGHCERLCVPLSLKSSWRGVGRELRKDSSSLYISCLSHNIQEHPSKNKSSHQLQWMRFPHVPLK